MTPERSICLIRLSAIGDVVNVASVVRQIQQQLPHLKITWIIGTQAYQIVKQLGGIEFILFDKSAKLKAYSDMRAQLADRHFDALLLMQYSLRANILSAFIRSPERYGYRYPRRQEMHRFFINHQVGERQQHTVDTYLDFARAIGAEVESPAEVRCYSASDSTVLESYLDPARKTLVISPSCSEEFKQWSVERYAQVADYAQQQHNMQVILSSDSSGKQMCQQIQANMDSEVINLAGEIELSTLCALITHSDLVISPDSAAAHIASAAGTNVIGLYAATNPQRAGPYHSLEHCVNRYPQAVEQFLGKTVEQVAWGYKIRKSPAMDLITVSDVTAKIDSLIKELD